MLEFPWTITRTRTTIHHFVGINITDWFGFAQSVRCIPFLYVVLCLNVSLILTMLSMQVMKSVIIREFFLLVHPRRYQYSSRLRWYR